jgi:ABC-type antimicrobial peptide transport system permease subunit
LLSFISVRKTKEVGIRKVLGASVGQIVRLFATEFVVLVLFAFLIAAPLSYYWMNSWLNGFAYHTALTWWMFVAGAVLTLVVTIATIGHQSIKAAVANPVNALRTE